MKPAAFATTNDARSTIENPAAFAGLAAALGDAARVGRLFGAVEASFRVTGFHLYAVDRLEYERHMSDARSKVDEGAWATAQSEGEALSLDEAAVEALRLNQG